MPLSRDSLSDRPGRIILAALALLCVGLQFGGALSLSALALGIWLSGLAVFDRSVLRRLWMPRFWLVTIGLALLSGLFVGERDITLGGIALSASGLSAGGLMVVRGAFIFGLMAWASRLFVSANLQRTLQRVKLAPLGCALSAAFALLPELTVRLRQRMGAVRGRGGWTRVIGGIASELVFQTAVLAEEMARLAPSVSWPGERSGATRIGAVVGPPGSGKTTLVRKVADRLRSKGLSVGGVSQPRVEETGVRVGYRLSDLASGEERMFATRVKRPRGNGIGFQFEAGAWVWARQKIITSRRAHAVTVVDELGLLEAAGDGHLPALREPISRGSAASWLLAVRAECAVEIEQRLGSFARVLCTGANEEEIRAFGDWLAAPADPVDSASLPVRDGPVSQLDRQTEGSGVGFCRSCGTPRK